MAVRSSNGWNQSKRSETLYQLTEECVEVTLLLKHANREAGTDISSLSRLRLPVQTFRPATLLGWTGWTGFGTVKSDDGLLQN